MHKSDLIKVFFSFSSKELRHLRKFVSSPYFNQRSDVIRLFEHLSDVLKNSNTKERQQKIKKEEAFKIVHPEIPYDDKKMRYTMSFLLQTIYQYLTWSEFNDKASQKQYYLCHALRKRGVDDVFEKILENAISKQQLKQIRNPSYHFSNYLLLQEKMEYVYRTRRAAILNLQALTDELSIFFVSDFLRHSCTILSQQSLLARDYNLKFLDTILSFVEKGEFDNFPAVMVYYYAFMALSEKESHFYFQKLRKLIEEQKTTFPPAELRDIYLLAINHCIKKINKGERNYARIGLDLYVSGLNNDVLIENGRLSKYTYKNAISMALMLKSFDDAKDLMEKFKSYLAPDERENHYVYNLAIYYFRQLDYGKAMELLQKVHLKEVLYNLDARRMLLRAYYELGEYYALDSLLNSFSIFLRRQKKLGYHKEMYLNLIKYTRKLVNIDPYDKSKKAILTKEISIQKSLAEKEWLIEKLK